MGMHRSIVPALVAGAIAGWPAGANADGLTVGFGASSVSVSQVAPAGAAKLPPDVAQKVKVAGDQARKMQAQQKATRELDEKIKTLRKGIDDQKKKLMSQKGSDAAKSKETVDKAALLAAAIQKNHDLTRQQMQKVAGMAAVAQSAKTPADANKALAEHARLESQLDSMAQSNEMQMLQLQQLMQRQQQMMQTLSNIMKQMHDTQKSIIANLK